MVSCVSYQVFLGTSSWFERRKGKVVFVLTVPFVQTLHGLHWAVGGGIVGGNGSESPSPPPYWANFSYKMFV